MNKKNILALAALLYGTISFGGYLCIGEFYFIDNEIRYSKFGLDQSRCEDLVDYWANHFRTTKPTFYSSKYYWWESEAAYSQRYYTKSTLPFPRYTD